MAEVTTLAPWYGSNRMLAKHVGEELAGCNWVGVPFAGGMTELAAIKARTINANDKHEHLINLARVMADAYLGPRLYRRLKRVIFHPGWLEECQSRCIVAEGVGVSRLSDGELIDWAVAYFVCAWMTRHATAGTPGEFTGGISTRWTSSGGDSNVHYRSAVKAINEWRRVFARCNFTCLDFQQFLGRCKDQAGIGIYCDPPFPGPGDKYTYKMSTFDHAILAKQLADFKAARVVCRFYDVKEIRDLYPQRQWTWRHLTGRKQTNDDAPEVLILNGESRAK